MVHALSLPGSRAGLYRIAQEALNNVTQHANARRVTVRLVTSPEQAELTVQDDGRGFDVTLLPSEHHYGLVGLNERTKLLRGQLSLESDVGVGTKVKVVVPLKDPVNATEGA